MPSRVKKKAEAKTPGWGEYERSPERAGYIARMDRRKAGYLDGPPANSIVDDKSIFSR
jgi:hypothetical protein